MMYNNSKANNETIKTMPPAGGKKVSMKMNNAAMVRKVQKISLRFMRRERAILYSSINNSEKGSRWNALRRERNKCYRSLFNELLERGIEPSSIPIFK